LSSTPAACCFRNASPASRGSKFPSTRTTRFLTKACWKPPTPSSSTPTAETATRCSPHPAGRKKSRSSSIAAAV
jgi:hypothetical protein